MRIGYKMAIADTGKRFVLTALGYIDTPDRIKAERAVGEPVKGFETGVPLSWVRKKWVREVSL